VALAWGPWLVCRQLLALVLGANLTLKLQQRFASCSDQGASPCPRRTRKSRALKPPEAVAAILIPRGCRESGRGEI
jgi:hypothetical protein